jgi:hypothetical protein
VQESARPHIIFVQWRGEFVGGVAALAGTTRGARLAIARLALTSRRGPNPRIRHLASGHPDLLDGLPVTRMPA